MRNNSGFAYVWLVPAADVPRALVAVAFLPALDDEHVVCRQPVVVLGLVLGSRAAFLVRLRDPVVSIAVLVGKLGPRRDPIDGVLEGPARLHHDPDGGVGVAVFEQAHQF